MLDRIDVFFRVVGIEDIMLEVKDLKKSYGDFAAVKGSSFSVKKGEVLAIIGPNGAGKSTTLKSIIGLISPTSGSIRIDGMSYEDNPLKIKQMIGYMPEESSLYEDMKVLDYLYFFADIYGVKREVARQRINHLLSSLNLDVDGKVIGNLSKGMKRKVLIARSLINNPKILVYDEPASGLDPSTTNFILNYIKDLKSQGKVVIITAHNMHHIEMISDNVIIMNKGQIVEEGPLDVIKLKYGKTYAIKYLKSGLIHEESFKDSKEMNHFVKKLVEGSHEIVDVHSEQKSLEEIFMLLTKQ